MAAVALDDIWDAPLLPSPPRAGSSSDKENWAANGDADMDGDSPRPTKRARTSKAALFLPDDDDDDNARGASFVRRTDGPTTPVRPPASASAPAPGAGAPPADDLDALFAELDRATDASFRPLRPDLDLDALRREAEARHHASSAPRALASSSPPRADGATKGGKDAEEGPKPRKKPLQLNEERLLSAAGFPALIESTKGFKPKGKGHEAADLARLLKIYQFWAHRMYPRTNFRDTARTVEKLCHKRRMHVALTVWRDEAHGIVLGQKDNDEVDLTSDAEADADPIAGGDLAAPPASSSRAPSLAPGSDADVSSGGEPLSSSSEPDLFDDFDIEAAMIEDEARAAAAPRPVAASRPATVYRTPAAGGDGVPGPTEDDEAMWDEIAAGAFEDEVVRFTTPPPAASTGARGVGAGDEADMDSAMRDAESEPAGGAVSDNQDGSGTDTGYATNDEGWDDMYE